MEQNNNKGMTALLILQLVFIILKLLDAVKWSWGWVLSPIWIVGLLALIVAVITSNKR